MYEQTVHPQRAFAEGLGIPQAAHFSPPVDPLQHGRAMRRRLQVFFGVFSVCLLLSLAYNFSRSGVYQATARVQITPAGKPATVTDSPTAPPSPQDRQPFLVEVQTLTSRPLLEKVVQQLQTQGLWRATGNDPVLAVQEMLTVSPVDGTQIVQLQAQSSAQALVAPLVNTVIEVYRNQQVSAGDAASQTQLVETRDEIRVIEAQVAQKKRSLEALRLRSSIVSSERDENLTLSRLKGLNNSLSLAADKEATAAGRVRALEQAIAEGRRAPQAKDNPTVANIESRVSQMKEEWRALERQFTPQYLDMDANARALKTRIGNLEQQLDGERQKAQHMALADAQEQWVGAQATAQRLLQQLSGEKQEAQAFSRRFGEFQTMQAELQGLEKMRQSATQKLLALESSEAARKPRMLVMEPAATPDSAWRPLYWRDAGIGVLASLVLGFLAVWFVEFFNRVERQSPGPSTVLISQPWRMFAAPTDDPLGIASTPDARTATTMTPRLENQLPRELRPDEIDGLLAAAAPENLPILACLLCGLTPQEVLSLQLQHISLATESLRVAGEPERRLPLVAALRDTASQRPDAAPDSWLFFKGTGHPLDIEDINAVVTSSAHDAHLEQPQSVTPTALRHTYIAFLVRQGLRFSELSRLVGRLNADAFNTLAPLAPQAHRVSIDAVDLLLPGLKRGLV